LPHQDSVFGQLLKLVPRHEFDRLAATHHTGAKLRRLTRWSQFVAMATAHLARRFSLRDVMGNLKAHPRERSAIPAQESGPESNLRRYV
jgi:Domain of unknown function (DUF4372)